jgi:hypothetical protein
VYGKSCVLTSVVLPPPADNSARDGDVPAGNDDVTRQLSEIKEEISRLRITLRRKHRRVPVPDA